MATRKAKKTAARSKRPETKNFNMKIPLPVWDRLKSVADDRGVSVAALLLNTTMEKIGPAKAGRENLL